MKPHSLWHKEAIIYEVYIRAYKDSNGDGNGDIKGLTQKLDYIADLGVTCIWLLPHYPSPLKDDGYDISDYYNVHPDFGTINDFKLLVEKAHSLGIKIIIDLVLNHTSDQHPWFQEARKDRNSPFQDYYVWSDTDEKYPEVRIIFSDTETSNWTFDDSAQQYFWHRFYASQPDLNFENPHVEKEMLDIVKFWLDIGVDGFRIDAVAYLFEKEGTSGENLPETHQFLKRLRKFMDEKYRDRILLSEVNQWPEDTKEYFSEGDEVHMNFQFPLMPRIFMSIGKGLVTPLKEIMERMEPIPDNCQWGTFLRNHDELTLEMVSEEEKRWMQTHYAPEKEMLINGGIRRRLAPLLNNDKDKILLANSLLFTLPGSPIIYYGDEIGMGDDISLFDRNGVRTPMQWDNSLNGGFSKSSSSNLYAKTISSGEFTYKKINVKNQLGKNSLLESMKLLIHTRKKSSTLSNGDFCWANTSNNEEIAAYWRIHKGENILVINNLSDKKHKLNIFLDKFSINSFENLFTKEMIPVKEKKLSLNLNPFQFFWFASNLENYYEKLK